MTFHFKNKCLPKEEFGQIALAMENIGRAIMVPHLAGFVEDGQDYYTVDFIVTPNELIQAVKILNDFVNAL